MKITLLTCLGILRLLSRNSASTFRPDNLPSLISILISAFPFHHFCNLRQAHDQVKPPHKFGTFPPNISAFPPNWDAISSRRSVPLNGWQLGNVFFCPNFLFPLL